MKVKSNVRAFKKESRKENLEQQIRSEHTVSLKKGRGQKGGDLSETESQEYMSDKLTRKILGQAQMQRREVEGDGPPGSLVSLTAKKGGRAQDSDEEWSDDEEYNELDGVDDDRCVISAEERAVLAQFEGERPQRTVSLADLVMARLDTRADAKPKETLNPKIVDVYTKVGTLLSRYKSGKLPKAFKVIPSLKNWQEILCLTKPEEWTVHSMYQATRMFASNLNAKHAVRFYHHVLLERVRRDISESKKLNYHLYMALKKCVYKPAAFFKGILLPLVASGCTLKEAAIVGSVLVKTSIPVLHSAAAILKLIELDYCGAQSLVLKYLMDKKYALPFMAIDRLVAYFVAFERDGRPLPVLWQQSLLLFVQRYKEELTLEQKGSIAALIAVKHHVDISPEIKRELDGSKCRGETELMDLA